MNTDFDEVGPKDLFKSFPELVDLPPLKFKTGKASRFDALILGKGK